LDHCSHSMLSTHGIITQLKAHPKAARQCQRHCRQYAINIGHSNSRTAVTQCKVSLSDALLHLCKRLNMHCFLDALPIVCHKKHLIQHTMAWSYNFALCMEINLACMGMDVDHQLAKHMSAAIVHGKQSRCHGAINAGKHCGMPHACVHMMSTPDITLCAGTA
jgi:hypothetical protein